MAELRPSDVNRRRRRWSFAGCVFDEANWTLSVDGKRVAIETKPLEILRVLLLRAGNVVSKGELLDAVWPDVEVVEASLTTAVRKLRNALGEDRRKVSIIETAQRIGYRLAVPVTVEELSAPHEPQVTEVAPPLARTEDASSPRGESERPRFVTTRVVSLAVLGIAAAAALALLMLRSGGAEHRPVASASPAYSEREVKNALRNLEVGAVERMIAAGWDAKTLFGKERADSLSYVLEICEWNPAHDRQKMLIMARTLIEAGARVDRRNVWGDTAYSIAKAPRYCGPAHPVTRMIRRICGSGPTPLGDRCMASYELARGQHFVPEPKPRI